MVVALFRSMKNQIIKSKVKASKNCAKLISTLLLVFFLGKLVYASLLVSELQLYVFAFRIKVVLSFDL
ncbi:MAG: hypothetical protein M1167_01360, partial [Chloroflexi bacterium]|nr:hypothetical protein [Chloroflexota bacterium]